MNTKYGSTSRWVTSIVLTLIIAGGTPATLQAQLGLMDRVWLPGNETNDRNGEAVAVGDFNGDGFDDLAVGVPDDELVSIANAGLVRIHFGSESGIASGNFGDQVFREDNLAGGETEAGDHFGSALAAADFDRDGAWDLAIGIPGQVVGGDDNAGAVAVVYGVVGSGLDFDRVTFFNQIALAGSPEPGDQFGATLAAGRIGTDIYPDLAVGVIGESINNFEDAGAVNLILSNGGAGLSNMGNTLLHQDVLGAFGVATPDDRFGTALAIGDVTGDGTSDLVVGVPGDRVGLTLCAGAVQAFPGAVNGVAISADQVLWSQDTDVLLGTANTDDDFGSALALGHFNNDTRLDLAIGIPGESQFGPQQSGAVQILYGSFGGLATDGDQIFFESLLSPEVNAFDRFGETLAAGDFDADGHDDLAIGLPLDNVFGVVNAGNVVVLYGTTVGLQQAGAQLWNGFFLLTVEPGDELGFVLATGRFDDRQGGDDLVIGVPGRENDDNEAQAGGVLIVKSRMPFFDGFESGDTSAWSATVP